VEIYSEIEDRYKVFEGLIDTGASICALSKDITEALGIEIGKEKIHLWQVRDPLVLGKTILRIKYEDRVYDVEAVVVDIPKNFCRYALPEEECSRPEYPNPLASRIILGENFLNLLPEENRREMGILIS
jgi:hypothetical protein